MIQMIWINITLSTTYSSTLESCFHLLFSIYIKKYIINIILPSALDMIIFQWYQHLLIYRIKSSSLQTIYWIESTQSLSKMLLICWPQSRQSHPVKWVSTFCSICLKILKFPTFLCLKVLLLLAMMGSFSVEYDMNSSAKQVTLICYTLFLVSYSNFRYSCKLRFRVREKSIGQGEWMLSSIFSLFNYLTLLLPVYHCRQ